MNDEELAEELAHIKQRITALEDALAALDGTADEPADDSEPRQSDELFGQSGPLDARDDAALSGLDAGTLVTTTQLKNRYREFTDIRNDATLRSRIRSLTNTSLFDAAGTAKWNYLGRDDDRPKGPDVGRTRHDTSPQGDSND